MLVGRAVKRAPMVPGARKITAPSVPAMGVIGFGQSTTRATASPRFWMRKAALMDKNTHTSTPDEPTTWGAVGRGKSTIELSAPARAVAFDPMRESAGGWWDPVAGVDPMRVRLEDECSSVPLLDGFEKGVIPLESLGRNVPRVVIIDRKGDGGAGEYVALRELLQLDVLNLDVSEDDVMGEGQGR